LHLATHGEFKPGQPANSYIQFWNQERLTLDRLRELGLNNPPVELLVLSACRTAVGDLNAELGFAGLAVQAGVKSALASLWYVSDEGTLALMSEFYDRLTSAPTKALALQQAQVSLIEGRTRLDNGNLTFGSRGPIPLPSLPGQSQSLAHPYYWAAFITIGSPW
jgi:CHAT domain-containing protein